MYNFSPILSGDRQIVVTLGQSGDWIHNIRRIRSQEASQRHASTLKSKKNLYFNNNVKNAPRACLDSYFILVLAF